MSRSRIGMERFGMKGLMVSAIIMALLGLVTHDELIRVVDAIYVALAVWTLVSSWRQSRKKARQ